MQTHSKAGFRRMTPGLRSTKALVLGDPVPPLLSGVVPCFDWLRRPLAKAFEKKEKQRNCNKGVPLLHPATPIQAQTPAHLGAPWSIFAGSGQC